VPSTVHVRRAVGRQLTVGASITASLETWSRKLPDRSYVAFRRESSVPLAFSGWLTSSVGRRSPYCPTLVSSRRNAAAVGCLVAKFRMPPGATSPYWMDAGPLRTSTCSTLSAKWWPMFQTIMPLRRKLLQLFMENPRLL
jgi:hypothetical protein